MVRTSPDDASLIPEPVAVRQDAVRIMRHAEGVVRYLLATEPAGLPATLEDDCVVGLLNVGLFCPDAQLVIAQFLNVGWFDDSNIWEVVARVPPHARRRPRGPSARRARAVSRGARMPFGRHKGRLLREILDDYLLWVRDLADLREPLHRHVEQEYERRRHVRERTWQPDPPACAGALAPALWAPALQIISRGFRVAAHEAHPDHGGSHEAMLALQAAKAALEALVKGAA